LHPTGIGPASSINNPVQPFLKKTKDNSSAELDAELPPRVFPQFSDEDDTPQRQGEELPPSTFPEELDDKSHVEHDAGRSSDKGVITNRDNITASITKQTPVKKVASEVPDMLRTDAYNRTVYEDGTDGPIQNDTVRVTGPNVINNDKTHEEDVTAPSMGKKENESNDKNVSVTGTSVVSSLNASEGTFDDKQNVSTVHEKDSASTEEFIQSENITEVPKNEKNGTSRGDTFTTIPVTEGNIAVKNPKENDSISDKNKEKKVKSKSDNNRSEATIATESNTTVKDEPTNRKSGTTIKDEPTIRTETNTTIKNEPTTRNESNTEINNETAKPESVSSTIKELSITEPSSTQPVQHSAVTTLQPTLQTQSTTSLNISENSSQQKVDDKPLSLAASQQHGDHSHASSGKSSAFLQPTESAAILAGAFVGIALFGYIGLLIWRRVLE
jgi:hypothetical protein